MGSCGAAVAVDELERDLGKFIQVEDSEEDACASEGDDSDADVYDDHKDGPQPVKEEKCLVNSSALPSGNESPTNTSGKVEDGDEQQMALQHSMPSLQLVSALKGGREKIGVAPRKMSVTWAPDVYDPIPNSLSHTVKGNKKKSRKDKDKDNKRNKKGQKGGGKDKKQLRKHGGRSDKGGHRTVSATVSRYVHVSEDDLGGFDAGSPDYCGSSFLKESQTNFHFPVAEAL